MLNVQRSRGNKHLKEIDFTRRIMWMHLIIGGVVTALFLFHEVFAWFAGSMAWYGVSLAVMFGFMNEKSFCRWLLALVFLAGAGAGLYFISQVYPGLQVQALALVPHRFIPLWLGLANLAYGSGTLLMLFDSRIRRAGEVGFILW